MAIDLTALTAEVERDATVNGSAAALISGLAAQLEAAKGDPVAIQALADKLRQNSDQLAAAVAANTPSEPPTEPPVEPGEGSGFKKGR